MPISRPAIMIALVAATLTAAEAHAQDSSLYHVQDTTYGCADPYATRALTNPDRPPNAGTIKATFTKGRCVSVTPKSPWRFISRDSDVALMEYAGDVGQPGSYYFRADQLIGPNGGHPGETAPPVITGSQAGPGQTNIGAETALAPENSPPVTGAPATNAGTPGPTWGVTEILLLVIALGLAGAGGYVLGRRSPASGEIRSPK